MLEQKVEMVGGRAVWSDEKDISILTKHHAKFGDVEATRQAAPLKSYSDNTRT